MLIVQISDVHCGPQFQAKVFEEAVEEVNALNPDAIIVTGDLTEQSLLSEFRMAQQRLNQLECKNIIILSGNHDYRSTGYLIFKQFFPLKGVLDLGEVVIISINTARPERDDGEVGYRQMIWAKEELSKHKDKFKIAAMHHHLVPIPDAGPDRYVVLDAGDALQGLIEAGVNLVLCGHRHRPWKWVVEGTPIIHSGSFSSERLRGFFYNSYNIIEISGREVNARLKVIGNAYITFDQLVKERSSLVGLSE